MSDGRDEEKLEQPVGDAPIVPAAPVVDDWASAFAALEEPVVPAPAGNQAGPDDGGVAPTGVPATVPAAPDAPPAGGDAPVGAGDAGGPVPPVVEPGDAGGEPPVDVEATIAGYSTELEQRAINETAQTFLDWADEKGNKLIRQTNGRLGATINDPDIYKVDPETGAGQFFNPDTGRPFTGDNPRAQAKAWCDVYNEELRDTFNESSAQRQTALEAEMAPVINLLKFSPKFDALDPVRQQMFEALIADYEVFDSKNEVVGYSCDLDKALAQVNRQVAAVQASRATPPPEPTSPALDMPNSGGGDGERKEFKNLGEAIESLQDQQLAEARKK